MNKPALGAHERLRFIEFLLIQYGHVNRSALMRYFGISMPQAALDLKAYRAYAPGNMTYDATGKRYTRADNFARVYE